MAEGLLIIIYMRYHCEQCYNNVEHLFIHKKNVHNDMDICLDVLDSVGSASTLK